MAHVVGRSERIDTRSREPRRKYIASTTEVWKELIKGKETRHDADCCPEEDVEGMVSVVHYPSYGYQARHHEW